MLTSTDTRIVRRLFFATLVVAVLIPVFPAIAAPLGGTLTGRVVMKTAGATLPATPLTVTLLNFNPGLLRASDEAADARTTTTTPDGSFHFSGLDTSSAGVYRVIARYKGVEYEPAPRDVTDTTGVTGKSRAVRFTNNATTVSIEIPVYEPVASDNSANVTITSHQIIINEVRPQFYSVLEALQITNPGDRTLVGALNPDGSVAEGMPFVFTAPANAQSITTNRTDLLPTADLTGQKLTLRTAVQPGASDLTATYTLSGSATGLTVLRTLDYAAAKVQVLVSDSRQAIASTTLHNDGAIQAPQGATPFKQFSLTNARAGQQIDLTIGPSPATPAQASTPSAQKSTFDRIREKATVPFLLLLAGICLLLMLLILRTPQRPPSGTPDARQTEKEPVPPTDEAVGAKASPSADPPHEEQAGEAGAESLRRSRHVRGRPHDYDLDDAEREIEAANAEPEKTRDGHS